MDETYHPPEVQFPVQQKYIICVNANENFFLHVFPIAAKQLEFLRHAPCKVCGIRGQIKGTTGIIIHWS